MNLKKRGNTFYVRRRVPASLRGILERDEVVRTTGTTDEKEARRRSYAILAQIEDEFQRAAGLAHEHPTSPKWVQRIAREFRIAVDAGEMDAALAGELMHQTIEQHLRAAKRDPDQITDIHEQSLKAAADMVSRPDQTPLSEAIQDYLGEKEGRVVTSTLNAKRRALEGFSSWLWADLPLKSINRQHAGKYVGALLANGLSPKTNKETLSVLSSFWGWAIRRGLYEAANPWAGQGADLRGSRRGTQKDRRRPWKPEELKSFIGSLPATDNRWQAVVIAAYTGMRLNEICHMETSEVNLAEGYLVIPEGKTESSVRQVPIHPTIKPLLKRLVKEAGNGFVLQGLQPGGDDAKRGHGLSKRIGRHIRVKLGIADRGVVFHTLRSTFINAAENAAIPESTVKLIVGHARQSLTFGTYSRGVEFPVLQEAVQRINHTEVDHLIATRLEHAE